MERGNGHAKHEPERRDSRKELIAAARMQFDALRAVGILTPGPARSIVHLLESDEGTLSMHGRAFRDNIIRYLKALIAAAAIIPAMSVFFAPSHESLSPPPRAASLAVDSDAASVPSAPAPAIFPSAISPAHAGEEPYERPSTPVTINTRPTGKSTPMAA